MLSVCVPLLVAALCTSLLSNPASGSLAPDRNSIYQRIHKGVADNHGKHPYIVALLHDDRWRFCTGTLIAPTWVLTAAHCVFGTYIRYGNMTVQPTDITTIRLILKRIPHPSYKSYKSLTTSKTYNDIALLLVEKVPLEPLGILSALDYYTTIGLKVEFAGLGITTSVSKYNNVSKAMDNQKPLQVAGGVIASCQDEQRMFYFPKICVAPHCFQSQSVMPGDSGAPLFVDGKIIGVNVAVVYKPRKSVFTPVSPYMSWILQVINIHE